MRKIEFGTYKFAEDFNKDGSGRGNGWGWGDGSGNGSGDGQVALKYI